MTATASTSSQQISAARDEVALGLLDDHAHNCVLGGRDPAERDEKTDELLAAIGRLMRRG
jgi:DNA-binding FrmR family transcriptional regulator